MSDKTALQQTAFNDYKALIQAEIVTYSQSLTERWQSEYNLETIQVLDSYLSVLARGGKLLRGSLGSWTYSLAGGTEQNLAVHIGRILEMIHVYLLVVDDVADQSQSRRGGPSAHMLLAKYHQDEGWFGDGAHFGQMQAINASLAMQHLITQEISELAVADTIKLEALRELSVVLFKTTAGQIIDMNHQALRDISEHEVLSMMQQKTAYYSFVSPLQCGVIMAGKDWSDYAWLEAWAINIGLGFQINDDILGIFGDEKLSGKSNLDDLREGKMTLLMVRALAQTNATQKSELLSLLGRQDAAQRELERAQTIIEDTGALAYCQGLSKNYTQKAILSLDDAPMNYKLQVSELIALSQGLIKRQS